MTIVYRPSIGRILLNKFETEFCTEVCGLEFHLFNSHTLYERVDRIIGNRGSQQDTMRISEQQTKTSIKKVQRSLKGPKTPSATGSTRLKVV